MESFNKSKSKDTLVKEVKNLMGHINKDLADPEIPEYIKGDLRQAKELIKQMYSSLVPPEVFEMVLLSNNKRKKD